MKITVLGAGAMGSAVAYDLCHRAEVDRVQVCEARPGVLRTFRAWLDHPRLKTYETDARDIPTLETLLAGSACVVSCVAPELNPRLAALALRLGAHFVDLGGPEAVFEEECKLAPQAEAHARWVVPSAGLAPGLVNVLTMRGITAFDRAVRASVRVGDVPVEPREPFHYRLAHSAEKLIEDYTQPVAVLREGRVDYRPPLTGLETISFGEFGPLEAFYAGGGLASLAKTLEGRLEHLDVKTLRYPGHALQMRFLLDLGLAERTALDVRTHLTYRDVLVRRMRQRLGGEYRDAVIARVEIEGEREGAQQRLVYELVEHFDEASGISAMRRCTAFPAAAIAVLLATKQVPGGGVAPPEQVVPPGPFFEALAARGIHVRERWEAPAAVYEPAA
ncbi:MAG TPA: saccharopine dehydrogenase C-terminal domain-containing protein [Rubricoccaceae bacterium]|nr:saccharopine dehydrogenase C-terminal domain-containing protein [Rubricoccaceae bacterium]